MHDTLSRATAKLRRLLRVPARTRRDSAWAPSPPALPPPPPQEPAFPQDADLGAYIATLRNDLTSTGASKAPLTPNACSTCLARYLRAGAKEETVGVETLRNRGCGICDTLLEVAEATPSNADGSAKPCIATRGWWSDVSGVVFAGPVRMDLTLRSLDYVRGHPKSPGDELSSTGDDTSMARIKSWIVKCLTQHPSCVKSQGPVPPLPTRIVDVGLDGDPVLVCSEGRSGIYITLSHRWSGTKITTTTSKNLEERCSAIPWDSLTNVMQEAIAVARSLHVRYLWIDSLCILQDSTSDWNSEATRMASVYQNSLINIAADCSHDHAEGIFRPRIRRRKLLYLPPGKLIVGGPETTPPLLAYYLDYTIPSLERSEHISALDTRGWVLQESLLAPRTIKFRSNGVVWGCPHHGDSTPFIKAVHGVYSFGSRDLQRQAYKSWHEIVESYSRRVLTNKGDKLMAMAGIARYTGERLGQRCIAGLWEENLARDLLWTAYDTPGRLQVPGFAVPSWSWASIDGAVTYIWGKTGAGADSSYAESMLQVVSINLDEDTSLNGVRGELVVRGNVVEVGLDRESGMLLLPRRDRLLPEKEHEKGGRQRWYPDMTVRHLEEMYPTRDSLRLLVAAKAYHYHCICIVPVYGVETRFERVGICRVDTTRLDLERGGRLMTVVLV